MNEISTTYNPEACEDKWYQSWEKSGAFKPKKGKANKSFTIIVPPPNVTGRLHAGHALDITTQDAVIRFKRMKGYETLFLPGLDHAGIATQSVVEKQIFEEEKKTRHEFSREEFVNRIWNWKEKFGDIILNQQKKMGASTDWDYLTFTLDPIPNLAVRTFFVSLYNQGLIYQSDYIVNWDPVLQSAISDAEVEHQEINGNFYHLKYYLKGSSDEFLEVATTRPETMFGDTAVAVHPEDERYTKYIGKTVIIPISNKEIPVIADSYVDQSKGTGCLKVTPGHDFNDFQIGKRHQLAIINILNKDGTLNDHALEFAGLKCKIARNKIAKKCEELELLVKTIPHRHPVGHGERSHEIIEPMVSKQWFVNVQKMSEIAVSKVEDGTTQFFPKEWENTYFSWLKEPKDWCISRQLWWGHQIPVYYCQNKSCNHRWADIETPKQCPKCIASSKIEQDPDVLDTWFSSGLWPLSTLGWPDPETMKLKKFETFYPSSVLVTGFDIIFFWVARMMMMSLKVTNQVPFNHVYIHAIVRDKLGRKMSKSLGNGIEPLDMIRDYGADAFRFALASGAGYGRTINLDPDRIAGFRNFINKIWNAYRFISPHMLNVSSKIQWQKLDAHEKWIIAGLNDCTKIMNESLEIYRYDEACSEIYSFVYEKFCSWFIELSKNDMNAQRVSVLKYVFKKILALLHPITPFITEELWSYLKSEDESLLISTEYPEYDPSIQYNKERDEMNRFIDAITLIRNLRASVNMKPKEEINVHLLTDDENIAAYFKSEEVGFKSLARVNQLFVASKTNQNRPLKSVMGATSFCEIYIPLEGVIDLNEQINRLKKELEKTIKEFSKYESKIKNDNFMKNAPEEVRNEVESSAIQLTEKINSLKKNLEQFN